MKHRKIIYVGNKLAGHGYTPTTIDTLGPRLEALGYDMVYAGNKRNQILRLLQMMHTIWKYRKTAGVVLIDTYSTTAFYFAIASAFLSRYLKIKYIPILHGGELPGRIMTSPRLSNHIFRGSYTNVAVSQYLQLCFNEQAFNSTLIPNSIDLQQYKYKHRSSVSPSLLWVRSFHAIYRPEMAINVLHHLVNVFPNATLKMIGPAKDESFDHCKQLVDDLQLTGKVTFYGLLSKAEWITVSEHCGIFLNTSKIDNAPVSVIEAMALGMPVVSSDAGGISYLVEHGSNGVIANTVEGMSAAIVSLCNNPDLAAVISKNARDAAILYDWEVVKQKWHTLLEKVVQDK